MKRSKPVDSFVGNEVHLVSKKFTKSNIPLGYYSICKPPKGEKNDLFGLWVFYKDLYFKLALADLTRGSKIMKVKRTRNKNGKKKRRTRRVY